MIQQASGWTNSIRSRLFALALVPAALVSVVFAAYNIHHSLERGQVRIEERGRIVTQNLALSAELALIALDIEQLRALCAAASTQADVIWAGIRDPGFALLAESGSVGAAPSSSRLFSQPIGSEEVPLADYPEQVSKEVIEPILGWAEVRLSTLAVAADQQQQIRAAVLIALAGLGVAFFAALYLGVGLSRGLLELTRATIRFSRGDQTVRVHRQSLTELDEAARGFNRMASALEQSQALMQRQVSSATHELKRSLKALRGKNQELEKARENALAASRDKDEFLARMSHEMRTPLNAVIGFGRLLREEARTEAAFEYSQTLDRAAHQLLSVIDDILNYAKLRSSSVAIQSVPFDLRACLEDVVAMLGPEAYSRGLELALIVHGDLPDRLTGDPGRIGQVLLNLLNNAIKFTARGHVFVEAGYQRLDDHNETVSVSVADTGIGLSLAEQERLFEPFEQADPLITRRYGGTGLGLAITKRLIEQMGGEITVSSAPGRGARFTFKLPCRSLEERLSRPSTIALSTRKVLLCDPAPIQVRALRSMLVNASMEVFATSQPERLEQMLQQARSANEPFDILVLGAGSQSLLLSRLQQRVMELRAVFEGPLLLLVGDHRWAPTASLRECEPVTWTTKPVRRARLLTLMAQVSGEAQCEAPVPKLERLQLPETKALVVDDNGFNRSLMRSLLEVRGMEVFDADDGAEAIRLTASLALDLVFMDIHMPTMDGVEVTKRIRAGSAPGQRPSIIALSADAFIGDRIADFSALFDGFLLKPVSELALDEAIRRACIGESTPAPGRVPAPIDGAAAEAGQGALAQGGAPSRQGSPSAMMQNPEWRRRLNDELGRQVDQIRAAIAADDRQGLRARLHDLKGLCGLFGLHGLDAAISALSRTAATAPVQHLDQQLQELEAALASQYKGTRDD